MLLLIITVYLQNSGISGVSGKGISSTWTCWAIRTDSRVKEQFKNVNDIHFACGERKNYKVEEK